MRFSERPSILKEPLTRIYPSFIWTRVTFSLEPLMKNIPNDIGGFRFNHWLGVFRTGIQLIINFSVYLGA